MAIQITPGVDIAAVVGPGYVNHSDLTRDGLGNVFAAVTIARADGSSDVLIVKRDRENAALTILATFDQATYGKNGYATVQTWGPHLIVWLSSRNAAGNTVPKEWILWHVAED